MLKENLYNFSWSNRFISSALLHFGLMLFTAIL